MNICKHFLLLFLGGASLLLSTTVKAQTSEPLADFDKIRISGRANVELIQADRNSYYLDAFDGQEKPIAIDIRINNKILNINGYGMKNHIKVKIYFKNLEELACSGIATITHTDTLRTQRLQIKSDGAAKIKLTLKVSELKVDADGASDITLDGVAEIFTIQADGASSVKAERLMVDKANASSDGTSSIKLQVTQTITANADGVSSIQYIGSPANKNISVDGMAQVKSLSDGKAFSKDDNMGEQDTVRVKIGRKKFLIIDGELNNLHDAEEDEETDLSHNPYKRRSMKSVWGGIELGINGFTTPDLNFRMQEGYTDLNTHFGRSWFIGFNFPELDGHLIRNKLAITTGLGIKWSWMEFKSNNIMRPDTNTLVFIPSGNNLQENELNTFNITLPVLLKLAPGNKKKADKGLHIAAGIIAHYVATTRLKTVTADNGYEKTTNYVTDFGINPFRVDGTIRFGYDWIRFFANYSLTPYIDAAKAPDIRLFTAGVTLIGF
jgi:hypothetical protein